MLVSMKKFLDTTVEALDGPGGRIHDFYFDDEAWQLRYLVIDTGSWLPGRKVLIAPQAISRPWTPEERPHIQHSQASIKDAPAIDVVKPISRPMEIVLFAHYTWLPYWEAPDAGPNVGIAAEAGPADEGAEAHAQPRLRSFRTVHGYSVESRGEGGGRLSDLIFQDGDEQVLLFAMRDGMASTTQDRYLHTAEIASVDIDAAAIQTVVDADTLRTAPTLDAPAPHKHASEAHQRAQGILAGYYQQHPPKMALEGTRHIPIAEDVAYTGHMKRERTKVGEPLSKNERH